jgi:hypothetical protein
LRSYQVNSRHSLHRVRVRFNPQTTSDGLQQWAAVPIPEIYRFQELTGIFIKGTPDEVDLIEGRLHKPSARVYVNGQNVVCEASMAIAHFDLKLGSDAGLNGSGHSIFAVEGSGLAAAYAGGRSIDLKTSQGPHEGFDVECVLRIVGTDYID